MNSRVALGISWWGEVWNDRLCRFTHGLSGIAYCSDRLALLRWAIEQDKRRSLPFQASVGRLYLMVDDYFVLKYLYMYVHILVKQHCVLCRYDLYSIA